MARQELPSGNRIGEWAIVRYLAAGGNGEVYLVRKGSQKGVLKRLKRSETSRPSKTSHKRFVEEIQSMSACQDIPGVLRLLDHHVTEVDTDAEYAWFVAERGTPLDKKLKHAALDEIIIAVLSAD